MKRRATAARARAHTRLPPPLPLPPRAATATADPHVACPLLTFLLFEQDGAQGFYAVWDHWLLDTLTSWQRQPESGYAISEDQDDDEGVGGAVAAPLAGGLFGSSRNDVVDASAADELPPRKRPRSDAPTALGVNGAALPVSG